jgi:hypothetical protein
MAFQKRTEIRERRTVCRICQSKVKSNAFSYNYLDDEFDYITKGKTSIIIPPVIYYRSIFYYGVIIDIYCRYIHLYNLIIRHFFLYLAMAFELF